jgi:hypothetical protein
VEWIVVIPLQRLNLSRNMTFRSLEIRAILEYSRALKELLLTVTSPVFSEIVVVFSGVEARWPPRDLAERLHEIYKIREFRVAFCLETAERLGVSSLRIMKSTMQAEVAKGSYDFLPCPPLVFFPYSGKVGSFYGWTSMIHHQLYDRLSLQVYSSIADVIIYRERQCKSVFDSNGYGWHQETCKLAFDSFRGF